MKTFTKLAKVVVAAILVLLIWITVSGLVRMQSERAREDAKWQPEDRSKLLTRLRAGADAVVREYCSNTVVGITRIVRTDLDTLEDNPAKWSGNAVAEFINRVGGVERTNLPFVFKARPDVNNRQQIYAVTDYEVLRTLRGARSY
jgi:hypothetical protein